MLGQIVVGLLSFSARSILFLCFLALAAIYCLRSIHDDYFVTVVERARRTDDDLLEEFTYYDRSCNVADVTATVEDAEDLFIRPDSLNQGVDQMMTHGAVLFPDLLNPSTVQELRQFVVAKNAAIKGTSAEFPVSQSRNRISYGIDATEHPAVVRALKEIHDNAELKLLLEGLLGENPALTEITAITASYGCQHQVWHPDVKPDGNGVMFGRTYSHSYSLFIPLQNTTAEMGATDLCAGTHYCAAEDLIELCERVKIGMHQVSGQGFWPAGSAALLNQQVWHRGAAHTDPYAPERVVFIVSFLGRPNDTRQLSRGTYFHMKWNMWGHTWKDLSDSVKYMSWPWNIFTCLHIWRTASHGWGYDLITSAALRIGNNQLGCEPSDLERFLEVLDRIGSPSWLDGTIDFERRDAWQVYIRETLQNYWNFLLKVNKIAAVVYFGLLLLVALVQSYRKQAGIQTVSSGTKGALIVYLIVIVLAAELLYYVRNTPWMQDVYTGRTLMRPFPPLEKTLLIDPAVSKGPSTFPHRRDFLFAGRMDARTIGAYNRWYEFHPGNQKLLQGVAKMGASYRSYNDKGLAPIFQRAVMDAVMEPILLTGGRFLQQDYRTGEWLEMLDEERDTMVHTHLFVGTEGPLFELRKEYNFLLGDARFGYSRETAMARVSLGFLRDLDVNLFRRSLQPSKNPQKAKQDPPPKVFKLFKIQTIPSKKESIQNCRNWMSRWTAKPLVTHEFVVGEEVVYKYTSTELDDTIFLPATLVEIREGGDLLDVAFYSDDLYYHDLYVPEHTVTIPRATVEKFRPLKAGSRVLANYEGNGKWFTGKVVAIGPTGWADILYSDKEYEEGVSRRRYRPLPE